MTEIQAYKIMFRFLEDRYFRLPSDDLGGLLGELSLQEDGKPGDPAIMKDWERAVAAAKADE
jgi:hypothetical protein